MSRPRHPAPRPPAPLPISTDSLEALSGTLFAPNLKPPRVVNPPKVPSLAGSKLAPPWAELDERPAWRVRRFKLWRDNAPGLRLAVLDPRRRGQLKRYQSFALPTGQAATYGVRAVPVLLNPKPNPAQPTPRRPLVMPRTPYPWNPGAKIPKWDRKARYQRLLQYKYVLDQEHERRFRSGMRALMGGLYHFERSNLREYSKWGDCPWSQEVDVGWATELTRFFKDIKKKSTNIFHHLQLAQIPIKPVWRREEVHRAVKAEHKRRDKQREKKEAKKAAEQARQDEEAAAAEAAFADAEAELFIQLVAAGVTEQDRAGELEELDLIRERVARVSEEKRDLATLSGVDDVAAELRKTTEQIAALKLELARLEAEEDTGNTSSAEETVTTAESVDIAKDGSEELARPKKKRHRPKIQTSPVAPPPDSPLDEGLTDASTISTASIRTPKEISSRRSLSSAQIHKSEQAGTSSEVPRRPARDALLSDSPRSSDGDSHTDVRAGKGAVAKRELGRKRLTSRDGTGPLASHELHDEVAKQLAEMMMAVVGRTQGMPSTDTEAAESQPAAPFSADRPRSASESRHGRGQDRSTSRAHSEVPSLSGKTRTSIGRPHSTRGIVETSTESKLPSSTAMSHPALTQAGETIIEAPQPSRHRISRLVNLDRDHVSPPSSPTRFVSPLPDPTTPERMSITRAPSPVSHPSSSQHPQWRSPVPGPLGDLLDIDLAVDKIIPQLMNELSLSSASQRDHEGAAESSQPAPSSLQTTHPASDISFVYGDLNRDEDTAALFASSAPRSEELRVALATTDDDDDDSASDDSYASARAGAPIAGWTRGSDAASEPDTQLTARPIKPRRPVFTS